MEGWPLLYLLSHRQTLTDKTVQSHIGSHWANSEGGCLHTCLLKVNWPLGLCSGCRGSAIARIIGDNAKSLQRFATTVKMWVFEENINGRKLTDIINTEHENIKYLPGYKLPENVVRDSRIYRAPLSAFMNLQSDGICNSSNRDVVNEMLL